MTHRRILVIDDDVQLARLIELGLSQSGDLTIYTAPDGRLGALSAASNPPDLILLDYDMPVMDGLDTLRRLRANESTARTPIVAITGSHRSEPRCAEMIAGCTFYLPKPFTMNMLRNTVRTLLDTAGALKESAWA